ncbi:MAG: carboxypeptidase-like regulatory domain-containing protein, partial [Muribaculaceae bacterium]|nr:carboxypeptidase-like regulatory domain-containing protein [Muribaculaceae bacterium]
MKQLFTKLMALLFLAAILPANAVMAQRTISGVILSSEDHEPLPGASVAVSETQLKHAGSTAKTLGTVTNIDGEFSIAIPKGVTEIECRSIGYNPRTIVLVDGVNHYDIVLDPSSVVLSDVVVTGYQAIERRKLTASITKMELDDSKLGAIMNIDQALAGQVAGLSAIQSSGSPGAPLKIRIRGTSSLQGTQDPLWVIDGVPMNGTE